MREMGMMERGLLSIAWQGGLLSSEVRYEGGERTATKKSRGRLRGNSMGEGTEASISIYLNQKASSWKRETGK